MNAPATLARNILGSSHLTDSGMLFALAPALTPAGLDASPSFFHGFATHPRALAQGLVTLAGITATRYFKPMPVDARDPVMTAHGDRLRAEVFSADNSVYARLDVLGSGLDGGEIGRGTTNVDIGPDMRRVLSMVKDTGMLHLDVGTDGLEASTKTETVVERPVRMPDRWVRALGNAAADHTALTTRFSLSAAQARSFIASLPPASSSRRAVWLLPTPQGVRTAQRPAKDAVWVDGLHRLTALKRLLTIQQGLTFFGPVDGSAGPAAVEVTLPGARLSIALTPEPARGYSGEGSLLEALASPTALDDAALVSAELIFEPIIDVARLAASLGIDEARVRSALGVLATSGRVGWDFVDGCHFHRELPDDPSRVAKDNPRLVRARSIVDTPGAIQPVETGAEDAPDDAQARRVWLVDGGNGAHRVSETERGLACTCTWALRHQRSDGTNDRGPCAHALAVMIATNGPDTDSALSPRHAEIPALHPRQDSNLQPRD